MTRQITTTRRQILLIWTVVYVANLVVCLNEATGVVHGYGWLGVWAGCTLMWVITLCFCASSRQASFTLLVGAVFVGLLQMIAIVHLIVGIIALDVWKAVCPRRDLNDWPAWFPLGTFSVTMMTGTILVILALIVGHFLRVLFGAFEEE